MFGLFKQNTGHSQEKGDFFFLSPFHLSILCVWTQQQKKEICVCHSVIRRLCLSADVSGN